MCTPEGAQLHGAAQRRAISILWRDKTMHAPAIETVAALIGAIGEEQHESVM